MEAKKFLDIDSEKRKKRNIKNYFKKKKEIPEKENNIEISKTTKQNKKFGIKENITRFIFKESEKNGEKSFRKILEYLIEQAIETKENNWCIKQISFDIYCESITDPVIIPPRSLKQNSVDVVFESFFKLQQSYSEINLLNQEISLIITTYSVPVGSANKLRITDYFPPKENGKLSVKNNADTYCLFYSILLSKYYQQINAEEPLKISHMQFRRFYQNEKLQREKVTELISNAKIKPNQKNYGIEEIQKIQELYDEEFPGNFLIIAFSKDCGLKPIFKGECPRKYLVCIYNENGHWDGLKSVKQFFNIKYKYCVYCEETFQNAYKHTVKCLIKCGRCSGWGPNFPCKIENIDPIECDACYRIFYNQKCFKNHLEKACKFYKRCVDCDKEYYNDHQHICGEKICKRCKLPYTKDECCFIKKLKIPKLLPKYRIICYDVECSTDNLIENGKNNGLNEHKINFISARYTCSLCEHVVRNCDLCGPVTIRHKKWCSIDKIEPMVEFLKWVLSFTNYETYCYAHYAGKLITHLPPIEDYYPDSLKKNEFIKFKKWYDENYNTSFLLEDQLEIYCGQDTEILMNAVLSMRRIFLEITKDADTPQGYDVIKEASTLAGVAMRIFRAKFLKEKHLAIIPEGGFEKTDTQSSIAIKYFEWFMYKNGVKGRHAGNGGEIKIGGFKLDFICGKKKVIIEFQGCAFHGCPKCYKSNHLCPNENYAEQNFLKTQSRMNKLKHVAKKYGLNVEEIWECDLKSMLNRKNDTNYNSEMKNFFDELYDKGPIDPRDAFSGGRTQAFCLYAESDEKNEINMADIVSLYPAVNYFTPYPIKKPKIIIPKSHDVLWTLPEDIKYDGLLKVRVIPPKKLKLPLLPSHIDSILFFTNCGKCPKYAKSDFVLSKYVRKCRHTDKERSLYGLFTSIELKLAMDLGYKIDKFYRAYHFEEFDSELFKGYVRKFLKLKVESSGWSDNVQNTEQKEKFINEYKRIFNIEIDHSNMCFNPGLRHISKLMLNSLWGKFGMRNRLFKNKIINNPSDFFNLLFDHKIKISKPIMINEDTIRVIYQDKKEFVKEHNVSNIVIALWTTSQARIYLYNWLQKIDQNKDNQLLYSDTDSVVYRHPICKNPITFGNYLGEMSHENSGNNILEFVSGGSKQYSIKYKNISDGQIWHKTKIRGITFNKNNEFDHDDFKNMILDYNKDTRKFFQYEKFGPSRDSMILTRELRKEYKPVQKKE